MIKVDDFWNELSKGGYEFFSGVPCSILSNILDYAIKDPKITYVPAVRENNALGIASGAYLAGKKSGILIQNSGLGNIINGLLSFNLIYDIPVLMFITWRGYQGNDAPEHVIMGEKMMDLLEQLDIPTIILSEHFKRELSNSIKLAEREKTPVAVIIKRGIIG